MKKKIIFILPSLSHPRHHKRINALKEFFDVEVYAFDRGLHQVNKLDNVNIHYLGKMENKRYLKRLSNYWIIASIINKNKSQNTLFYLFSLDFALVGSLFLGRKSYIYEIGDFAYSKLGGGILKNILSFIDYHIIKKSFLTVLTSDGFSRYLKEKHSKLSDSNFLVIPNKSAEGIRSFERKEDKFENAGSLRFGFVGILRFANTVFRFIRIIGEKYPEHSFVFYGDGGLKDDFLKLTQQYSNLHYGGSFRNPEDLGKVYNGFDIHVGCYDLTTGINQKIAEPNKLYESIYFGNPIVATEGTFFGDRVKGLEVGFTMDGSTDDNIISFIDSITVEKLNELRFNMLQISPVDLITTHETLINSLKET